MMKSLYVILASTFFFGFLTGVLVYVATHTGKEGDGGIESISKDLVVVAEAYGGCIRQGCSSYRIQEDGAYVYILWTSEGNSVRYEDVLVPKSRKILEAQVASTDLKKLTETSFSDTCPITFDGIAYRYTIEYKGIRYEFDSCENDLNTEPLFMTLVDYFAIFEGLYGI